MHVFYDSLLVTMYIFDVYMLVSDMERRPKKKSKVSKVKPQPSSRLLKIVDITVTTYPDLQPFLNNYDCSNPGKSIQTYGTSAQPRVP